MIDYMQYFRFIDEPWETAQPPVPVEDISQEELKQVGGALINGGEIYSCPAFVNM